MLPYALGFGASFRFLEELLRSDQALQRMGTGAIGVGDVAVALLLSALAVVTAASLGIISTQIYLENSPAGRLRTLPWR